MDVSRLCSLAVAVLASATLLTVGCDDTPTIAPAAGKITLNGGPLPGPVSISFSSATFSSSFPVGADGEYTLRSEFGPGIPPGTYVVTIKRRMARVRDDKTIPADTSYVPKRYRSLSTSGLEAVVTDAADGGGPFNFDMTD